MGVAPGVAAGPEPRFDLPRPHVVVEGHVVPLHGAAGSDSHAALIERAGEVVPRLRPRASWLGTATG